MTTDQARDGRWFVPPRWAYRLVWALHRAGYRFSGGRLGLRSGTLGELGRLWLRTVGRRSGRERATMLYYLPHGEGYAVVASNAGADEAPAWWLNLQARAEAEVEVPAGSRRVRARLAAELEHERLWARFIERSPMYTACAQATERDIPIVILEPSDEGVDA